MRIPAGTKAPGQGVCILTRSRGENYVTVGGSKSDALEKALELCQSWFMQVLKQSDTFIVNALNYVSLYSFIHAAQASCYATRFTPE